jgi:hypothetical protein
LVAPSSMLDCRQFDWLRAHKDTRTQTLKARPVCSYPP